MSNERRRRPFARREDDAAPVARETEALKNDLQALPELAAPAGLWERVRERLDNDGVSPPSSHQRPMALAAGIAVIAAAAVLVTVHISTDGIETTDDRGIADNGTPPAPVPLDRIAIIEALMEQSQLAEERRRAVLAFYSPSGPEQLLRAHIGGIDAALNEQVLVGEIEPKSREALLRDRIDLIADLTDIERYRQHEFVHQVSF